MGYNTTVFILNDALHVLRNNPQTAIDGICDQIGRGTNGDVRVGGHVNPIHVMRTAHADIPRLYYTYGNGIVDLTPYQIETKWMIHTERGVQRLREDIESARLMLDQLSKELDQLGAKNKDAQ